MRNLFQASKILLLDLASTLLFLAVYALTGNLFLAVGLGMALGIAQIGWQLAHKQPVEALQWLSLVIIFASGTATFLTDDPLFVMMKPSIIYLIVGQAAKRTAQANVELTRNPGNVAQGSGASGASGVAESPTTKAAQRQQVGGRGEGRQRRRRRRRRSVCL